MMDAFFENIFSLLSNLSYFNAGLLFLIENTLIWILALMLGFLLQKIFSHKKIIAIEPEKVYANFKLEIILSVFTILSNTIITFAGFYLWRLGIIKINPFYGGLRDFIDVVFLVLVIDLAMYLLHVLAHTKPFYFLLHTVHHKFKEPSTITLFALHPLESLSFGILWLGILSVYTSSIVGIITYLTFNVVFGVIGHCGVEPIPSSWAKIPLLKYITNALFHVEHHRDEKVNYGFYTTIWDRLFRTIKKQKNI